MLLDMNADARVVHKQQRKQKTIHHGYKLHTYNGWSTVIETIYRQLWNVFLVVVNSKKNGNNYVENAKCQELQPKASTY